ncbi:hypothetical protein [Streptomyces variabilis]
MTKAEKAQVVDDIGLMVWRGAMGRQAAAWFIKRLYNVDLDKARDMVMGAMTAHMISDVEFNHKQIGEMHEH